jgi:hypothetical protein
MRQAGGFILLNKLVFCCRGTYLYRHMGYVRIIIQLVDGSQRSGVRKFPEPMNLEDIRAHAWQLGEEVLGRGAIEYVIVVEVPANDPTVVAMILRDEYRNKPVPRSDGEHPYLKQQRRKPPR